MTQLPNPVRPAVEVRRSTRRTKTVSATWRDGRLVVAIPSWMSACEELEWVERMVARACQPRIRRGARVSDEALAGRARQLSRQYLAGRAEPASISWVTNQNGRWGSCTASTGQIRLSHHLRDMPAWVVDYVIVHELAHLIVPGHGPRFWDWVSGYPHTERAKAFLQGVAHAQRQGPASVPDPGSAPDETWFEEPDDAVAR